MAESKVWELKPETELRCIIPASTNLRVRLLEGSGSAELFGIELSSTKDYHFTDENIAIFSWYGCKIETHGVGVEAYIFEETPMIAYVNTNAQLEARRDVALSNSDQGPRVMLVGPGDSGKSTLSRILTAYAARLDRVPVFLDLDVGQGSSVPGTITAIPVEKTALSIDEGFLTSNPLVYFFGHASPRENVPLYKHLVSVVAARINSRLEKDVDARSSGIIVNTCGWIDDKGVDVIMHAIQALSIDIVLVMSHDRLYATLSAALPESAVTIVKLPRSGGVVERSPAVRRTQRKRAVHEYFYGPPKAPDCPVTFSAPSVTMQLRDLHFLQHVNVDTSGSLMPIGEAPVSQNDQLRLKRVAITAQNKDEFLNSVVAVLNPVEDDAGVGGGAGSSLSDGDISPDLLSVNAAGFMSILAIDVDQDSITFRSPCQVTAASLPSRYILLGSIKWVE